VSEQILTEILGEVRALNKRVGNLEDGQGRLETTQQKIETRIKSLEAGQQKIETRMESLETSQRKIETRMESEVIEKIGALFNGYSLRGEQIENLQKHLDQRLDSIETDTGYLVSRVARLEKVVK